MNESQYADHEARICAWTFGVRAFAPTKPELISKAELFLFLFDELFPLGGGSYFYGSVRSQP